MKDLLTKSQDVRATSLHLFNIKRMAILEGYEGLIPIIDELISSDTDVASEYHTLKLDVKIKSLKKSRKLDYYTFEALENYKGEQIVGSFIADFLNRNYHSIQSHTVAFQLIDFLSEHHRGIYQWMAGKGYTEKYEYLADISISIYNN